MTDALSGRFLHGKPPGHGVFAVGGNVDYATAPLCAPQIRHFDPDSLVDDACALLALVEDVSLLDWCDCLRCVELELSVPLGFHVRILELCGYLKWLNLG
jgi:hypothetical protein